MNSFLIGYTAAALAEYGEALSCEASIRDPRRTEPLTVEDFAPETLAQFEHDCGKVAVILGNRIADGASFWVARQQCKQRDFAPLVCYLDPDNKMRCTDA